MASEAGLQYALGGISKLGGKVVNSNGIQAALNNIERAAFRIPAKFAVASLGEAAEEYLQEILNPVFRNLALGENNEFKLFTEDAAYAALLAVLSVDVLEGPNIVNTDASLDRMGQTLRGQWGADASGVTRFLIDMGLKQERGTDAYQAAQAAQKQLDKGHALTNVALGSLYQKVMGSLQAEGAAIAAETGVDQQTAVTPEEQGFIEGLKGEPGGVSVKSSGVSALEGQESLGKTLASNIDHLADMDSVAQLTGQEMNDRSKKPSEQIRTFFSKIGSVFRKGFGEVSFGEYGVGGMLNHRPLNRAKMVTLEAVPSVIENGRVISDVADWKGRGYRSVVFAAPVMIGDSRVYVAAVVNQNPEGKFYLSECVDSDGNYIRIENNPSDGTKSGVTAQGGITATPEKLSSISNIPQPPGKVKLQSGPDAAAGLRFQQGLDPGEGRVAQMKAALQNGVETAAPEPSSPLETRLRQERGVEQEGPFTGESSGGIIEIGRSLGAKAVNYDVMDLATGEVYHFVEGSKIQDVQVFAGKGSRVVFRRADFFATRYGGKLEDWQHAKGFGLLETPDGDRQAEVYWVQCAGLGKFEFFLKEWLD